MTAKKRKAGGSHAPSKGQPGGALLGLLTALGAGAALWALFQWSELLIVRLGGDTFCSISDTLDCRSVWDSALARAVHGTTGMPVAAWGLCWGLVALALPLLCLVARADQKPLRSGPEAIVLTAAAGVATVLVMATSSLLEGKLCITCLGTHVLVLGYGAGAWRLWRQRGLPLPWPGLKLALGATLIAYLCLLLPGLRTPHDADRQGRDHLGSTTAPAPGIPPTSAGSYVLHGVDIGRFIAGLPPQARQSLSDSLGIYRSAGAVPARPPRDLDGPANARVRITDFTDALCGHCAALHDTIRELKQRLPYGLIAVDARHFPLDASCNSAITSPPKNSVRCLAAKAQICMEGRPGREAFVGKLFAVQEDLDEDLLYTLAEPYMSREELDACAASDDTQRKLEDDIAWALSIGIQGTPLVLINGRKATSFAPFLYAIVLTEGDADHPVFAGLPPANPQVHLH